METQPIIVILLVLVALVLLLFWRLRVVSRRLENITFDKKSGEVLHGKSWENFAPFMEHYPYDPERFRFIGSPIDGISFEEDRIVFIEFKTGSSRLSAKQQNIRNLVEKRRIEWQEIRDTDLHE